MGGGDTQKAKMAGDKNLEKAKGSEGSQIDTNKKAYVQCLVSTEKFECTASEAILREHAKAKHPKADVSCFPHLKK